MNNPDRKYYNVVISSRDKNITHESVLATNTDNFNQSIVDNPSDYYLSVLRFQIPTSEIPILIPEIESWPNTDINKTIYTVTLEYTIGPNTYTSGTINIIFVSTISNGFPRPITAQDPNPMRNPNYYYYVYDYRDFLSMINTAFTTAYNTLNAATGGSLTSSPPFFSYNAQTSLFSLHCPDAYLSSLPAPIKIYMNYPLFIFFNSFQVNYNASSINKRIEIIVNDYNGINHIGGYYIQSQQYPTLANWNCFKSIQIVSAMLPIEKEIVPTPIYLSQNNYNTNAVIKDFIPFYESGYEFRSFINYKYDGAYELINLNSNMPIYTVDITVFWIDRYGNKYLLTFPYDQVLSIKFVFIKKSTFTG